MNIRAYQSAAAIATALLADRSIVVPRHVLGDHLYNERRYDLSDVVSKIGDTTLSLIASTALVDQAEAGRLMSNELRRHAAELAAELFDEHCGEPA